MPSDRATRRATLGQLLRALAEVVEDEASEIQLLTVEAVAARLATSETNVRRLIKRGELPAQRVGKEGVRVQDVDLAWYLERGKEVGIAKRRRGSRVAA